MTVPVNARIAGTAVALWEALKASDQGVVASNCGPYLILVARGPEAEHLKSQLKKESDHQVDSGDESDE